MVFDPVYQLLRGYVLGVVFGKLSDVASTKLARGEQLLNRAVNAHKVSESGIKAFLAAVDPFHDKPIDGLTGWPDLETAPSVVRHWKSSTTITCQEDGGSILVYTWPILNEVPMRTTVRRNSVVDKVILQDPSILAPVVIYSYNAAQSTAASLPLSAAAATHAVPNNYFTDGACRLIGMGLEIHDVTAELYKQGTCTTFEIPQSIADRELIQTVKLDIGAETFLPTCQEICRLIRPPSNLNEMLKYPSTQQWEAAEGAYTVVPFAGHENPPVFAEYRTPWVDSAPSLGLDIPGNLNTTDCLIGPWATPVPSSADHFVFLANAFSPTNSKGVYLSGLNKNSTFTITSTFYLESFPNQVSTLLPLARPSAAFDPKALALISTTMQNLPVACRVRDNPMGEWFWSALETAIPVLGSVTSALFPEFSPLIAPLAVSATKYAGNAKMEAKKRTERKAALKNEVKQMVKQDIRETLNNGKR